MPEKLAQMREMFAIEAARNSVLPIGAGMWVPIFHPNCASHPPYQEWEFPGTITRTPEFCAPALGTKNNTVTIEADLPANASGVLYALGGFAGGVTRWMDDGYLFYEYNLLIISRTKLRSADELPSGRTTIVVETCHVEQRPAGPLNVTIRVGPKVLAKGRVPVSAPLLFTANDCLDIGVCLAHQSPWTTTTKHLSPSTATSTASTSYTPNAGRRRLPEQQAHEQACTTAHGVL